jgi:hypothetical protein
VVVVGANRVFALFKDKWKSVRVSLMAESRLQVAEGKNQGGNCGSMDFYWCTGLNRILDFV